MARPLVLLLALCAALAPTSAPMARDALPERPLAACDCCCAATADAAPVAPRAESSGCGCRVPQGTPPSVPAQAPAPSGASSLELAWTQAGCVARLPALVVAPRAPESDAARAPPPPLRRLLGVWLL